MSESSKRKFQVFISSTFKDLETERLAVMKALMGIDCIPAGMEDFPAFDEAQLTYIKRVIDESDYYVLIIGGRYGSLDDTGVSFTEREYEYAKASMKPILAFIRTDIDSLPAKHTEQDADMRARLARFRDEVSRSRIVKFWARPEELPGLALVAINQATKLVPQIGWVRGDNLEIGELVGELSRRRQEEQIFRSELEKRDIEIRELRDVLGRDADDATGLYRNARAIVEKGENSNDIGGRYQINSGDREAVRRLLERIIELALNLQATANDLYNCGVLATRVDLNYMSLQFHSLAYYMQNSNTHRITMLHQETCSGVALTISPSDSRLVIERDTKLGPQVIRVRAIREALLLFANAPIAQCELVYSQAWNICQEHREGTSLDAACELLKASYFARQGGEYELNPVVFMEFDLPNIDWRLQIGKPVPSCMLTRIAEITQFLAKPGWLEEARKWTRLAERQNATEPPNVTWYENTIRGISSRMLAIRTVEERLAKVIDI